MREVGPAPSSNAAIDDALDEPGARNIREVFRPGISAFWAGNARF
jgi:hypothetical protein